MADNDKIVFGGKLFGTSTWRRYPLFKDDPSNIYYYNGDDYWERRDRNENPVQPTLPRVINPVKLAFFPAVGLMKDDSREHEGVRLAEVWDDRVARTLWLGFKPFMLTCQFFRLYCIQNANWLRSNPGALLRERLSFRLSSLSSGLFATDFDYSLTEQLSPYLICALQRDGKWPYFRLPHCELKWTYEPKKKAAWQVKLKLDAALAAMKGAL